MIIPFWKNEGETPLETIERLKKEQPSYANERFTYAGRLDPMASGVLLLLSGDDIIKKESLLSLGKVYEVEVLFGFKTDTGDILGIAGVSATPLLRQGFAGRGEIEREKLESALASCVGTFEEKYPAYSSKPVRGKPLFFWAKNGGIAQNEIPVHAVEIKNIEFISQRKISEKELLKDIESRIAKVSGDFRQEEVVAQWKTLLQNETRDFQLVKIKVVSGGGAYMRVLAEKVGEKLGMNALAYSILRTKIGEYSI